MDRCLALRFDPQPREPVGDLGARQGPVGGEHPLDGADRPGRLVAGHTELGQTPVRSGQRCLGRERHDPVVVVRREQVDRSPHGPGSNDRSVLLECAGHIPSFEPPRPGPQSERRGQPILSLDSDQPADNIRRRGALGAMKELPCVAERPEALCGEPERGGS